MYELLSSRDGLSVLNDPRLAIATQEIIHTGKTRAQIDSIIAQKNRAFKELVNEYSSPRLSRETLSLALYSVGDNHK